MLCIHFSEFSDVCGYFEATLAGEHVSIWGLPGLSQVSWTEVIVHDTFATSLHSQLANSAEYNIAKLKKTEEG